MYIQINPCIEKDGEVTRCKTPEAMFFGVYVGEPGSYDWIADFAIQSEALKFAANLCQQHGYELCNNT